MNKNTLIFCLLGTVIMYMSTQKFAYLALNNDRTLIELPLELCLPTEINPTDVVSGKNKSVITIKDKLKNEHAYCSLDRNLYSGQGRNIHFYHLQQCQKIYKNNPGIKIRQQDVEIQKLNLLYHVIQISCKEQV